MSSDEENKAMEVVFILDVIGKPKEHLVEALERVSEEIGKEKGVTLKEKNIKEPTPLKDKPEFFTTFAELILDFEGFDYLMASVFKYMPAHIEIVRPEMIGLSNNRMNEIINELARRLHGYDEIARMMQLENNKLRQALAQATGKPTTTPLSPKENLDIVKKMDEEEKKKKSKKKTDSKVKKKSSKNSKKKK